MAERAAYADPDRGADLLLRRWPDADAAPEKAVHHLIEWGARTERLQPYFERAIHIAESRSDWATLEELAATVRRLSGARSRSPLLILIGNALLVSDDPRCSDAGFALLVEVAREAAVQGELELAVRIAERLLGYASLRSEPELRSTATDLRDAVKHALDASSELNEWRKMQDDRRATELAARFRGKNLHIVGGKAEPWAKTLEESVGFNEVRWHETEKKGSNNTDWADSLTADRDVVLVMWEQIGHAVSGAVKDKCSRRGVPRTESSCSVRDVMDELAKLGST